VIRGGGRASVRAACLEGAGLGHALGGIDPAQFVEGKVMKIALAQIRSWPGEVARNTRTIVKRIRDAAALQCDAVVLPEMSDTGYHMPGTAESTPR
jgi:hypothetical protein